MNKVKVGSNMYPFLNEMSGGKGYTWNLIRGECSHLCSYCYVPRIMRGKQGELRLDDKALKENLGSGNIIFVGSSCDMWANTIPQEWIIQVLEKCRQYPRNRYLFQSKNPSRFIQLESLITGDTLWGTTIETNRYYPQFMGSAPYPHERLSAMLEIEKPKMVSIEPIIDFDFSELVRYIRLIKPQFVSIGANTSRKVELPEPGAEKVEALILALQKFTEVKIKGNLKRITG